MNVFFPFIQLNMTFVHDMSPRDYVHYPQLAYSEIRPDDVYLDHDRSLETFANRIDARSRTGDMTVGLRPYSTRTHEGHLFDARASINHVRTRPMYAPRAGGPANHQYHILKQEWVVAQRQLGPDHDKTRYLAWLLAHWNDNVNV